MTRGQKKFLYGLFYILVLALIVWAFWPSAKAPVPPVCSGPSCGNVQPLLLQVSGAPDLPQMFVSKSMHRVVLLGQVMNPNPDYGASTFSYQFDISDRNGKTISSVPGSENIYPGETKYIFDVYDFGSANPSLFDHLDLKVNNASFQPTGNFLKPNLVLISGPSVQMNPDAIVVSGTLKNLSSFTARNVRAIALLMGRYYAVFAAQTIIQQVNSFQEVPINVQFPADQTIKDSIDVGKTQIVFYAE